MKKKFIFIHRWIELMVALEKFKGNPLQYISMRLGATYTWSHKIFHDFERRGWLKTEKVGRQLSYEFTELGKTVLENCKEMVRLVEGAEHWLIRRKTYDEMSLREKIKKGLI